MRKLMIGLVCCGSLMVVACSGDDGKKTNGGTAGSTAGGSAGSAGAMTAGGSSGSGGGASAGSAGTGTGGTGNSGLPGWPTYEEAAANPGSTRVLVLLLDFADSDQNALVPNAEERWGKMIFGRERSNGNSYWYEASAGQFQLLPAAETQLTPNNGVVHVKVAGNKPTSGVLAAEDQPWLTEALDKSAAFVDYQSFDKNGDGKLSNTELSVLTIINWEFEQIAYAPAQANIALDHPIAGTGVTLEKFARDMYLHTSIGISMHELGHHILDLDHTPSPTDHDLMGQGSYWPDPMVSTLHDPNWFNATRPTHPKAIHKVRAGWVTPTEITSSTQGVKLNAPELGKAYNVIKLPVSQGFLLLENRTAKGYDASIPFCAKEAGAIFVDEVAQYLEPLRLTDAHPVPAAADYTPPSAELCDVYALAGHNDTFTFGGWKISNVSAPGPTMTFDIEKLPGTSQVAEYRFEGWFDDAGTRTRHDIKLEPGGSSTIDYSKLSGGTSSSGFVSISLNAYYNTGEVRYVALDTTWTTDSPYITVANAGKYTNGGAPTPMSLTYVTIHPDQPKVDSAKLTMKTGTFEHTITFTNLPQN